MAHLIEVVCGFLSGKGIVVVDIDGLVGGLCRFAHNDVEQPFAAQICRHRTVLFGVEQDETICLRVGHHALDGVQNLCVVLSGNDRVHIPPLVAELPDAADDLQMECILVDVPLGGGQNDADGLGKSFHWFGFKVRLIAQLRHDAAHPLLGVPADGRAVLAGAGNRGGGDPRCCGDILDGNCHDLFLPDRYCFYCKAVCTQCQCLRKELRKSCNASLCVPSTTFTKNPLLRCGKRRKLIFVIENSCKNCGVGLFLLRKVTQIRCNTCVK